MGPKKTFGQESTMYFFFKFLRGMSVHQKLGIILESKVVWKLNLEKNVFTKKWSPKLIFLNEIFFLKIFGWFLTWKIDFESMILAIFDEQ